MTITYHFNHKNIAALIDELRVEAAKMQRYVAALSAEPAGVADKVLLVVIAKKGATGAIASPEVRELIGAVTQADVKRYVDALLRGGDPDANATLLEIVHAIRERKQIGSARFRD